MPRLNPLTTEIVAGIAQIAIAGPFAEEVEESRIGIQSGLLGADNVTRTWRVYCSSRTDNPIFVIQNLPTTNGRVQTGDAFPTTGGWGDGSYVLHYFTIIDHWPGTSVWTLRGVYVPSSIAALPVERWSFGIRSALETQRIYTTKPYTALVGAELRTLPSKGIGTPKYISVPGPTSTFKAQNIDGTTFYLELAGGGTDPTAPNLPRYMTGSDTGKRISVVNFSKLMFDYREDAINAAVTNKKSINSDAFVVNTMARANPIIFAEAPAPGEGIVLFDDFSIETVDNPNGGVYPAFRVSFAFKINPDGWQEVKDHTFRFDDGTEAPIEYNNSESNPVQELFVVNTPTSLSGLLGQFD